MSSTLNRGTIWLKDKTRGQKVVRPRFGSRQTDCLVGNTGCDEKLFRLVYSRLKIVCFTETESIPTPMLGIKRRGAAVVKMHNQ